MRKAGKSIHCGMVKNYHTMVQEGEKMVQRRVRKTNLFTVEKICHIFKILFGFSPSSQAVKTLLSFSAWTQSFSFSGRKWNMAVIDESCRCQEEVVS